MKLIKKILPSEGNFLQHHVWPTKTALTFAQGLHEAISEKIMPLEHKSNSENISTDKKGIFVTDTETMTWQLGISYVV